MPRQPGHGSWGGQQSNFGWAKSRGPPRFFFLESAAGTSDLADLRQLGETCLVARCKHCCASAAGAQSRRQSRRAPPKLCGAVCFPEIRGVCVLHITPVKPFSPVDILHNQSPCRFFNPREKQVITGRNTTPQRY